MSRFLYGCVFIAGAKAQNIYELCDNLHSCNHRLSVELRGLQASDSQKEEFLEYLKKTDVIDAVTSALVGLYKEPERPSFIAVTLLDPTGVGVEELRAENEELKKINRELQDQLAHAMQESI